MIMCKICNKEFRNVNGLAKHLTNQHKDFSKEQYYNQFIGESSQTCECGKPKKFRNLGIGYLTFCSTKCRSRFVEPTKYWLGRKQPQTVIEKRQNTIEKRYGVNNGFLTEKSKCITYKGFVTRSSYERAFVDYAESRMFELEVPQKIRYVHDGRNRWYYPDFFIKSINLIIEIKSRWTYAQNLEINLAKEKFTKIAGYDIIFIDESCGLLNNWEKLDEYFLFRF